MRYWLERFCQHLQLVITNVCINKKGVSRIIYCCSSWFHGFDTSFLLVIKSQRHTLSLRGIQCNGHSKGCHPLRIKCWTYWNPIRKFWSKSYGWRVGRIFIHLTQLICVPLFDRFLSVIRILERRNRFWAVIWMLYLSSMSNLFVVHSFKKRLIMEMGICQSRQWSLTNQNGFRIRLKSVFSVYLKFGGSSFKYQ